MKNLPAILCLSGLVACQPKHSPKTDAKVPETAETQPTSAIPTPASFVGLALKEAEGLAEKADLPHRVVKQDGEERMVTRDYRPERLNFTVEKGIVTQVTNG